MSIIDGGLTREPFIYLQGGTVRGSYPLSRCRPQVSSVNIWELRPFIAYLAIRHVTWHVIANLWIVYNSHRHVQHCGHDNVIRNLHPGLESFSSPPLAKANRRSHLGAFRAHLSGLPEKGKPSRKKNAVFFNIVQKAFDPPPPHLFEHYVVNFSEGILTKVHKRLS